MKTREQRNAWARAWRSKNKDKVREYNRQAYQKNKEAYATYGRKWRLEHREQVNARSRAWRAKMTPEQRRQSHRNVRLKARYGITLVQFKAMWEKQGGRCQICPTMLSEGLGLENSAHVDHDHDTGEVRGILCGMCNVGLGRFRDDADLLDRAAAYIRAAKAKRAA